LSKRNSQDKLPEIRHITPQKHRESQNILDALDAGPLIKIGPSVQRENYGYPSPDKKLPLKPRENFHRNRDFSKLMA
jgi:hypothetical protein